MRKISLNLDTRSYDILIGKNTINLLDNFLQENNYSKVIIITDKNIAKIHLPKVEEIAKDYEVVIADAGEATKSFAHLEKICEEILSKQIDRNTLIIALGGGVIGDLSGFVASILLRGIDFIQIPTTLLAAVDSSVGGKTAINSKHGKNLIGSFYQPKLVICDLDFLTTLPSREIKSGFAEVIKYGLIYDKKFFEFLENNLSKLEILDEEFLEEIIAVSCEIKAKIVSADEKEKGMRALLNFGHTFGHIFETEARYSSKILHGEAVAIGMVMAAKMSVNLDGFAEENFVRIKNIIDKSGLVFDPKSIEESWNFDSLANHVFKDKKVEGKDLTFILLDEIGEARIKKQVSFEEFEKVLKEFV